MDPAQIEAYLERIGAQRRPPAPTSQALRDLHRLHLTEVPFENLSIHLAEPILLEEKALFAKIVEGRRGGFCYELNGLFASLLRALGYQVDMLSARVFGQAGRPGPPYDHMTLRVTAQDDAAPWLADVGFGKHAEHPLRYDERGLQHDPAGSFRIAEAETPGGAVRDGTPADLDVHMDGSAVYRFEQRPRELRDFEATCWYQQTSPESHFTRSTTCSRLTENGGRITLSGNRLIETRPGGDRTERILGDDAAVLTAYREHFGIEIDRVPVVRSPAD